MGNWNIFGGKTQFLGFSQRDNALDVMQEQVLHKMPETGMPVLPTGTMLKGRYRTGTAVMEYFFITYDAVDTLRNYSVTVVEYFCNRVAWRPADDGITVEKFHKEFYNGYEWFQKQVRYASQMPDDLMHILDTFEENGTIYAVLEQERGKLLETELQEPDKIWDPEELLELLDGAMNMASRLHSAGFFHRWLGVDTIRICGGKSTIDCFGNVGRYPDKNNDPDMGLISSEPVRRIFHRWEYPVEYYSAKREIAPYSAVYAFAAIFVRFLTQTEPETAIDRLTENSTKLLHNNLPEPLRCVLEKAMAIRPADRYQTIEEFRWAMSYVINQE